MRSIHSATILLALLTLACTDSNDRTGSTDRSGSTGRTGSGAPGEVGGLPHERRATLAPVASRAKQVRGSAGAEVRVVGLMVNGETREELGGEPQLAFLGAQARTRVALEVVLPSGGIIDLDRESSSLELFRDDRGTNLAEEQPLGGPYEMLPSLAEDGRSIVTIAASNRLPATGAARIELRGSLSLITASVQKTHLSDPVELAPGAQLSAGPWSFEVTETGQAEWSDQWSFTLQTEDDLTPVLFWHVIDSAGARSEADPWMSMSFNSTRRQSLQCEQPVGPVRLELVAWDDARRVQVPFQTQVGLGLR